MGEVRFERLEPRLIAAIQRKAFASEFSRVVPALCGEVWNYVKRHGVAKPDRLLAIYSGGEQPTNLTVGCEVGERFDGDERVICTHSPGGEVAHAVHVGPYQRLGETHDAIRRACEEANRKVGALSWEVYGHGEADPRNLRTDVFYLLA